jgi:hypothetical protein
MIINLQHDFLKTLRHQQQAEDDEYSDDEVSSANLDTMLSLLKKNRFRVMMLFPRSDVSRPKVHFGVYWVRSTIGGADPHWRLKDCSAKCTSAINLLTNTSSTMRYPLLKIRDRSLLLIRSSEMQRMLNGG